MFTGYVMVVLQHFSAYMLIPRESESAQASEQAFQFFSMSQLAPWHSKHQHARCGAHRAKFCVLDPAVKFSACEGQHDAINVAATSRTQSAQCIG